MAEKHPHARGEDPSRMATRGMMVETPPRTWGRRSEAISAFNSLRNTPTHVGKTSRPSHSPSRRQKHPHARGEDPMKRVPGQWDVETPPRTWGRPSILTQRPRQTGNTPTHVGKTYVVRSAITQPQKHPHARGEDPTAKELSANDTRNTPTHVGKTPRERPQVHLYWKHPHARGEDPLLGKILPCLQETPPRTWGRPFSESPVTARRWKHPHARGEDSLP